MLKAMDSDALVSLPGSSWSKAPPSQAAAHAAAAHRAGRCPQVLPSRRDHTVRATTAYISAEPGAPVSRLAPPPNRPPKPSPRYQTDNAQPTEAASAQRTDRRCSSPAPSASWISPKMTSAAAGECAMTLAASWTGQETNPGCPFPAGAITCRANAGVSIAAWNWRAPSRIHSSPSVIWMPRLLTRGLSFFMSFLLAGRVPPRTAASTGPPGVRPGTLRRWRRDP